MYYNVAIYYNNIVQSYVVDKTIAVYFLCINNLFILKMKNHFMRATWCSNFDNSNWANVNNNGAFSDNISYQNE